MCARSSVSGMLRAMRRNSAGVTLATTAIFQLLREDHVTFRRRIDGFEQQQTAAQIPARKLARTGLHVDVAAESVQVQRQRIDERLAGVVAEDLRIGTKAWAVDHLLLHMPARLIYLAMHL